MKFLIDAELPYKLREWLITKGYDVIHTRDLPKANKTEDAKIIRIADDENRIVVSKDSDFLKQYILNGKPQKLLLITTGNINNKDLHNLFEKNFETPTALFHSHCVVEINNSFVIGHYKTL